MAFCHKSQRYQVKNPSQDAPRQRESFAVGLSRLGFFFCVEGKRTPKLQLDLRLHLPPLRGLRADE